MVLWLNDKLTDTLLVAAVTPIESVTTHAQVAVELAGGVPLPDQVTVEAALELIVMVLPADEDQA